MAGEFRPLNVYASADADGWRANDEWLADASNSRLIDAQILPGFHPAGQFDLAYFGGRTVAAGRVKCFYVGGDGRPGAAPPWAAGDRAAIDAALVEAFGDPNLESVMAQYFSVQPSVQLDASATYANAPTTYQQADVANMVTAAHAAGLLAADLPNTLFCFLLSPGTRLVLNAKEDSYKGMGGYHSSLQCPNANGGLDDVYYAVSVYSARAGAVTNGVPAFGVPWKSVVATLYHEINEWRTDPDVAVGTPRNMRGVIGWYAPKKGEIGDVSLLEARATHGNVFVEVALANGAGTVPVQIMHSNFDHGPAAVSAAPLLPAPHH